MRADASEDAAKPASTRLSCSTAILNDSSYTYVYGVEDLQATKWLHLARAPLEDILGTWQYWTGSGWSDDPGACIGNYVEDTVYGMGLQFAWSRLPAVVARNTDMIGTPAEKRRTLNLTMDKVQPVGAWLDTLSAYAGCKAINEAGVVTLVPNAPAASVMTFNTNNIVVISKGSNSTRTTNNNTKTYIITINIIAINIAIITSSDR